jgi:hypothetical protein
MNVQIQRTAFGALLLFQSEREVKQNQKAPASRFTAQQGQG